MNMPANLNDVIATGLAIQNYVVNHILVANMVKQLIVIACLYLGARVAAGVLRPRLRKFLEGHSWVGQALPHLSRVIVTKLLTSILTLLLLWVASAAAGHFHWPHHGISMVMSLLLAWVVIRLATSQLKNRTVAKVLNVIVWCIAALYIFHLLVPAIALLHNINLNVGQVHVSLLSLINGGVFLLLLFWLANKISSLFRHWIKTVPNVTPSMQVLFSKLLTLTLFTLGIFTIFYGMGIDLTAFAIFTGAIGLGIGFGLQKILANLISGFIILADKSIKPGDVIQMGDTFGWINFLGGRYISVVTRDGMEHLIPNEDLITNQVINWSFSNKLLRIRIPIGIGYDSDIPLAMELMLAAAQDDPRVLTDPKPGCLLMGFGDNTVDFQLRVWIQDPQNGIANVKSRILLGVWQRFQQHGIELPLPQRVVYYKAAPDPAVTLTAPPEAAGGIKPANAG